MFVAVAAAGLLVASATVAGAQPTRTTSCLGACHAAGPGASVEASLVSTSATSATYDLTMTGAPGSGWAVFDGSTKVKGATTATDTFTVDLGKTYNIFAVNGADPFNSATASVSPAAPSVEPTTSLDEAVPPVTTCDAVASYTGTAKLTLSATDAGGRGVAYVYYSVDGNRVHLFTVGMLAETSLNVAAPIVGTASHTISYWSQDAAGNVEDRNTKTFTVTAPPLSVVKTAASMNRPIAPSSVRHNRTLTVYGYMWPRHASGTTAVTLRFYRYKSGRGYVYYKSLRVKVYNAVYYNYSRYVAKTSLPYAGKWRVRAVHADSLHLTSYSSYEYLVVR